MNVEYKYAKMMYDYILETLLEQKQYELYTYALTALHTGLRNADMLELTWEQLDVDRFKNIKLHKHSSIIGEDVVEDIAIREEDEYFKRLNVINHDTTGKMFSYKSKLAITPLLRKYTGSMMFSHELRIIWSRLMIGE